MTDHVLTKKIQDWVSTTGGTSGRSIADASLHFMLQPLEIVAAVRNGYWMNFFDADNGWYDEDQPMPENPNWSKIIIEVDGE